MVIFLYSSSIFRISKQNRFNILYINVQAEFVDRTWASAYTIGNNGLGPWGKRPNIADDAVWIWNSKVRMGTHIISRVSKVIINSK